MITTYLRSSSYNTYDLCQTKYFIEYGLGYKSLTGKAALKGTIVHKVLEVLARTKKSLQEGKDKFFDTEFDKIYYTDNIDVNSITAESFKYYYEKNPHLDLQNPDFKECLKWVHKVLSTEFNPLKRNILDAEFFFDFKLKDDWAKYKVQIGDEVIEDYLSLKGTIDLLTIVEDKVLEVIDWKTGKYKKDWATNKDKDYEAFQNDFQIMLYHYALSHYFPDVETFIFTVYFINVDGPNTVVFTKKDLPRTLEKIKIRFEEIKKNIKPTRIKGDFKCKWCDFSKDKYKICDKVTKDILTIGIDRVTSRYIKDGASTSYSGGGRDK